MRDYVIQTWGNWDELQEWHKHRHNYTPSTHRIVLCGKQEAGIVSAEVEPAHLWLVKLYLRPQFQGLGIGTKVLQQVIHEAAELNRPIRLRVLRVNQGALRLYHRHGFTVVGEEAERLLMVRSASTP
jgi:ribosomal protein S18 acetylase RimI-like enzyme